MDALCTHCYPDVLRGGSLPDGPAQHLFCLVCLCPALKSCGTWVLRAGGNRAWAAGRGALGENMAKGVASTAPLDKGADAEFEIRT